MDFNNILGSPFISNLRPSLDSTTTELLYRDELNGIRFTITKFFLISVGSTPHFLIY